MDKRLSFSISATDNASGTLERVRDGVAALRHGSTCTEWAVRYPAAYNEDGHAYQLCRNESTARSWARSLPTPNTILSRTVTRSEWTPGG